MPRNVEADLRLPGSDDGHRSGGAGGELAPPATPAQWLEQSPLVMWVLALMLGGWIYYHFFVNSRSTSTP